MPNKLIMIVEDNPINMKLLQVLLKTENYNNVSAASADEVIAILNQQQPDLILMDVQLPGMDGLELTRELKNNPLYQHIPIFAITAYAMKNDREKALAAGCDGYISKPIDTKEFAKTLSEFFSEKIPATSA